MFGWMRNRSPLISRTGNAVATGGGYANSGYAGPQLDPDAILALVKIYGSYMQRGDKEMATAVLADIWNALDKANKREF